MILLDAPESSDAAMWSAIGVMVTGFCTLIGVVITVIKPRVRYEPEAERSPEREHVERISGVNTDGVSDTNVALFAKLYGEISQLRTREDKLEAKILKLKRGVEAGDYPPWPEDDD